MDQAKIKDIYNSTLKEAKWQKFWKDENIYEFDPSSSKEIYSIDTPPPTVSGAIHLGHVYSYTQAEVIARYMRLAGKNLRYPIGMDNNGLPTEKLVEKERGVRGHNMPLAQFVKICMEVTEQYREKYKKLWDSLGFSFDWNLEYSTISPQTQKLVQTVFKELYDKKAIYQKEAIALYCHRCRTFVAQAEVEDENSSSVFYDISFSRKNGEILTISTTRPELLPACVAVFVNPKDKRYKTIVGESVTTPLGQKVKVLADEEVSIEKGTGAVMCCTYGDETDLNWVKKYNLAEKIIIGNDGKFIDLTELPEMSLKSIQDGRKIIVSKLKDLKAITKEQPIEHAVGVHERCGTPIELLPTKQWFVKIIDKKEELIEAGKKINWHPAYMRKRYEQWVSGLKWDWCISRDRYFGVPIPAFVCDKCGEIVIPDKKEFPVDLKLQKGKKCPKCSSGTLVPEKGVLDTWFTSSLTPDINNLSNLNKDLKGKIYPMSMRPQAHDIIRTWVVYSILMGIYRHSDIPWKNLMIAGHILLRKGEKISKKTGGGNLKPEELIKNHSADAIRYTMCGALLGKDAFYDELEVKKGKRLINKLYNAGKLVISNLSDFSLEANIDKTKLETIDRWIIMKSCEVAKEMTKNFEQYEVGRARLVFEDFFWKDFCDNYLEIVKGRLWNTDKSQIQKRKSAQYALYETYLNILKMISPILPHISEEMYHAKLNTDGTLESDTDMGIYAKEQKSIHLTDWPKDDKVMKLNDDEKKGVDLMTTTISEIRKYRASKQLKMNLPIPIIYIKTKPENKKLFLPLWDDLIFIAKAEKLEFIDKKESKDDQVTINI